jgi:branched-chain amino acid transport system permease protein
MFQPKEPVNIKAEDSLSRQDHARNLKRLAFYVFPIVLLLFPLFVKNSYYIHVLNLVGLYVILTIGLDLVVGFSGLLHCGHAAFYGVGAYVGAIFSAQILPGNPMGFWLGIPLAMIGGILTGLLVGIPSLRLKGHHFALATLGFGEVMRNVFMDWVSVTNGPYGIKDIPAPRLGGVVFDTAGKYYYLIWIATFLIIFFSTLITQSRFGRFWLATREDETGALSLGIDTFRSKLLAFVMSTGIAALAGTLMAHYVTYIHPSSFGLDESILVLSMVYIGGRGSIPGAILGAAILSLAPEILRPIQEYRLLVYGLILGVLIIVRPRGILGRG